MQVNEAFPFSEYRDYQREILTEAKRALFQTPGIDTVVIDAPTGIGKSPINVSLARMADTSFYTTPQKKLRRQLEQDTDLQPYYSVMRARSDYTCDWASTVEEVVSCKECPVTNDPDSSCREKQCDYWTAKEAAMADDTAVLTFSYLIVDNALQTFTEIESDRGDVYGSETIQVSFADRELLIVDEAHALEEQVASLHAGFTISEQTPIPEEIYDSFISNYQRDVEDSEADYTSGDEVEDAVRRLFEEISENIRGLQANPLKQENFQGDLQELEGLRARLEFFLSQVEEGHEWVVSPANIEEKAPSIKFQPIRVDSFLQQFVWSRAEKQILSTATMPFRDQPDRWLLRLGLDPNRARVISKPMPFPPENRPIHTRGMIGPFTGGRIKKNWGEVIDTLGLIAENHLGEKGLIHTVSYRRAANLYEHFSDNAIVHKQDGRPDEAYIREWQDSDCDMLFTPSMMEGVDLPGEKCRWQVLVKVPYPSLADARTKYLLKELGEEDWYNAVTLRQMIQAVGRGVRNKTDKCDFYVLDESWNDVMDSAAVPDWFEAAICD